MVTKTKGILQVCVVTVEAKSIEVVSAKTCWSPLVLLFAHWESSS